MMRVIGNHAIHNRDHAMRAMSILARSTIFPSGTSPVFICGKVLNFFHRAIAKRTVRAGHGSAPFVWLYLVPIVHQYEFHL